MRYVVAGLGGIILTVGVMLAVGVWDNILCPVIPFTHPPGSVKLTWYQNPAILHAIGYGVVALGGSLLLLAGIRIARKP